ncbi:hypothetical protein [Nocardia alni]|uniref:hypothetical protein n=1 Tax=Nocardia alni TaxID=2815723 RepID=UPI001C21DF4B|nr:hypothetical protein [Nocardia alni]
MRISIQRTGDNLRVRMRWDANRRRRLIAQLALWILTIQAAIVAVWAIFAPAAWYRSFPGFGLDWVAMSGPYNHHLAFDVGAFFLALGAVAAAALFYADSLLVRVAGAGWVVFGIPHFIYHAANRPDGMSTGGFVFMLIAALLLPALGLVAVLAAPTERIALRDPAPMTFRLPNRRKP